MGRSPVGAVGRRLPFGQSTQIDEPLTPFATMQEIDAEYGGHTEGSPLLLLPLPRLSGAGSRSASVRV